MRRAHPRMVFDGTLLSPKINAARSWRVARRAPGRGYRATRHERRFPEAHPLTQRVKAGAGRLRYTRAHRPRGSTPMTEFFAQSPPRLGNQFLDDAFLCDYLRR